MPFRSESGQMPTQGDPQLVRRLRSACGHLQAITRMVEEGAPCCEVLHQLHAVQGALRAVSKVLLSNAIRSSEAVLRHSDCAEERARALEALEELLQWTVANNRGN